MTQLALNWKFLTKIWKPDTVFLNGQKCFLHKMTVPNRFIRVFPDGKVSYSQGRSCRFHLSYHKGVVLQRLTLWARCPMHLRKYPFDSQSCPLELGSFSYTARDVVYRWAASPVSMDSLQMAQYKLTSLKHGVRKENSTRWHYTVQSSYMKIHLQKNCLRHEAGLSGLLEVRP